MIASGISKQTTTTIRLRHIFPVPRESVFRAWTDPVALKYWWCPEGFVPDAIEIDLRVGGHYRFAMRYPGGGPVVAVKGSFVEVVAPQRLVYTWEWENAFKGLPPTCVEVQFVALGAGTEVILEHRDFPEKNVCLDHFTGWTAVWARFRSAFDRG